MNDLRITVIFYCTRILVFVMCKQSLTLFSATIAPPLCKSSFMDINIFVGIITIVYYLCFLYLYACAIKS